MGRLKFRSAHKFQGRRKNKRKSRLTEIVERLESETQPQTEDAQSGPSSASRDGNASASAKKLNLFGIDLETEMNNAEENEVESDAFFFIQKSVLQKMVSCLVCPKCFSNTVVYNLDNERSNGFCVKGSLLCQCCGESLFHDYLCERVGRASSSRVPFELNLRAVLAFRGIGCGQAAMREWCSIMNMPSTLSKDAYNQSSKKLLEASVSTADAVSKKSVEKIVESYSVLGVEPDEDGVLDIGVSFDGSWHKRGHSSHNGIAVVIDIITGLPVDYEVLSNFCLKCHFSRKEDDPCYEQWQESHKVDCQKNYDGSANSMEVECAKRMWSRSVEKLN